MRAAPDNKVVLRPLEQNLAPERYNEYGYLEVARGRVNGRSHFNSRRLARRVKGMDARSHCFACRIMTAVGWIKLDAPRREDRKEKPLLAWGRGRSPERELSLRT